MADQKQPDPIKAPATVAANATAVAVKVQFVAGPESKNPKAPKFRAYVHLNGSFATLVADMPIFHSDKDGSYSVAMPGGQFPAVKPQLDTTKVGERVYSDVSPEGKAKAKRLIDGVMLAFLAFRQTGEAEQSITL